MYTLSAMVHIEFAILFVALLWLMWMVAFYRASDLGRLEREVDDIKENQVYAQEVLRIALTEIIGVDKTAAVIESADRNFAEWKKGNPLAKQRGIGSQIQPLPARTGGSQRPHSRPLRVLEWGTRLVRGSNVDTLWQDNKVTFPNG